MDQSKTRVSGWFAPGASYWLLFIGTLFFQLDMLAPVVYITLNKDVYPAGIAYGVLAIGAVFCTLFVMLYLRAKKGLSIRGSFKLFLPAFINGCLLFFLSSYLNAIISGKLGLKAYQSAIAKGSAGGYTLVVLLGLLVLYSTLFFTMVYLSRSAETETGFMQSTAVYLESVKAFFRRIYISLPASVVLGAVMLLVYKLFEIFDDFRIAHMNANIFSAALLWIVTSLILAYVYGVFFGVSGLVAASASPASAAPKPKKEKKPFKLGKKAKAAEAAETEEATAEAAEETATAAADAAAVPDAAAAAETVQEEAAPQPAEPSAPEYRKTLPVASIVLAVLCAAVFFISGAASGATTADEIYLDTAQHMLKAGVYADGGDYRSAYAEGRIALSENIAMQAYIKALIINKTGQTDYNPADTLFRKAGDTYKTSNFLSLMKARCWLFLQNSPDSAVRELEQAILSPYAGNAEFATMLRAYKAGKRTDAAQETIIPTILLGRYYTDTYADLEKISLKKLYKYLEMFETQEKELGDYYYDAKARFEMSCGKYTEAVRTLTEWVNTTDSLKANYSYLSYAAQYTYEGSDYKDVADRALKFAESYSAKDNTEQTLLEIYAAQLLIECNQFDKCESYLADKYQDSNKLGIYYAYSMLNQKKYSQAYKVCEELLTQDADNYDAVYVKALCASYLGDVQNAERCMKKIESALASAGDNNTRDFLEESLYMYTMSLYRHAFDFRPDEFLEQTSFDADGLFMLYYNIYDFWNDWWYYGNRHEIDKEKTRGELYDEIVAASSNKRDDLYTVHYYKGIILYEDGDNEGAIEELNKAWTIKERPEIPFQLGYCYDNLDMYGTAIRMWNRVRMDLPVTNHNGADDEGYAPHAFQEVQALHMHLGEVR